jgi:16S rRNA (uracil1498-N3)-methyltransferase
MKSVKVFAFVPYRQKKIYRVRPEIVNLNMRYFFIQDPNSEGTAFMIKGSDANHIKNVLRLKSGDRIGLFDGKGMDYEARITAISSRSVEVMITRSFPSNAESPVDIIVAQAYLKEKKMDGLVRQLSELGVRKWIPFFASRSVPRPDQERLASRRQRWQKIAREALKQSKRGRFMEIGSVVPFENLLQIAEDMDLKIVFWEDTAKTLDSILLALPGHEFKQIIVVLGPEGGFSSTEIDSFKTHGFITASLGPRILRAETATLAATTLLQYLFGDLGKKILTKI